MRAIIIFVLIYFVRLGGAFTAEYMFGSIAGEADNRTLELLMTSISPLQFVVGKFLGLLAVGLTQLGMWSSVALGLGLAATTFLNRNLLEPLLDWEYLGLIATMLLAAYVMDQLLAAALGLLRVSGGAGGLLFGVLSSLVGLALLYAAYLVPRHPHTFLAVAASLFPVTAPLVLPIRLVVTEVPAWQIILSQVFVWGTILASFFWLRRLLQRNLLSYAPPFKLIRWLAARWPARGRQV
jgi:ABC-2 type transport system permease protein